MSLSQQEAWRDEAGAKAFLRNEVLPAINQQRRSQGLPVVVEKEISAGAHVLDMAIGADGGGTRVSCRCLHCASFPAPTLHAP